MPNYKLSYFDLRGRAEVARLLFAVAGVKFEDVRVRREDWLSVKPTTPFGQMPVLEVDGQVIAQSVAINNFLAREFGLYGASNLEAAHVDQIVCLGEDFVNATLKANREENETKKAELLKTHTEETVPKFLGILEKLLEKNSSTGFFVGKAVSLADVYVYNLLWGMLEASSNMLDQTPKLKNHQKKIGEIPKLKAYVETRPKTDY